MIRYTTAALALTLAACSDPAPDKAPSDTSEVTAAVEAAPPPAPAPPPRPASPTTGGDGSSIELTPLAGAEIEAADLQGELGWSFATAGAAPLLIAMGNVASKEPAFGLVKIGDYVERVAAPGGFDGLLKGATFSGRGTTIKVALTGPATAGGESPPRPARLTFDRMDGAQRSFEGRWSCGP